ncbi:hypothetical protein Tco_1282992, partial [Tanacetum coccineum]
MTGPEPITPLNEGTSNQNNTTTQSIIEGHVSALKELLKEQSNSDLIKRMLLNFGDDIQDTGDEITKINKKKEKGKTTTNDEDLSKPFKEVLKCPFTRRIIEFSSPGHRMPTNVKIYDGTGDPEDHISRFTELIQISSFMSSHKRLELSKHFSDSIPKTVDEMLKRLDDYVRSEEAFRNTKLPKGEFQRKELPAQWGQRNDRPQR